MELIVERAKVWAASIPDQPGGLSAILAGLTEAGVDLDFVIARRAPEKPGTGVVFVTPLRGDAEISAAAELGFNVASSLHSLRIEGKNGAGVGAAMTAALADAGINLRGLSAAAMGTRFVMYIGLDSEADAAKAAEVLKAV
ncbi:MAG: ACT domain-containing protein [Verrucomicrobia bacterium]|nr:ACT domain-containing protein [Verrucomicrobiota bacterium]